ncbi:MAG: M20/M25/M40 family metallo-hydrolase [Planctomycetota bacterium]
MTPAAVLALHRALVEIPSVSHQERAIAEFLERTLREHGARVERIGDNVLALAGVGPRLILNSHFDTVPAHAGWTRAPWCATREADRVYGLGSNDAKASVAAMTAAFLSVLENDGPCEVALLIAPEEETGGQGTELAWPRLRVRGWETASVVVGEPTGLDIAVAQKGLIVTELIAHGDGGHSATARERRARNAISELARDLCALERIDLGPAHALLGKSSLEPTIIDGGVARNMVPSRARCIVDVRTVPGFSPANIVESLRRNVTGELRVLSDRLTPCNCDVDSALVRAAVAARPAARLVGSPTMSDLVHFVGVPAVKCGPGESARSHQPDEYVLESEILAGADFYHSLIERFAREVSDESTVLYRGGEAHP